jgi:hypothetical protein
MVQDYFISIDAPDDIRKRVLESSKAIILNMKDYHQLLLVRKNKLELISVLQDQLKELTFLIDKFNKALPDKQIDYEKELYEEAMRKEAEDQKNREEQRIALIKMQEAKNKGEKQAPKVTGYTPAAPVQPTRPTKPVEPQISDVDRLAKALSAIEEKLKKL